MASERTTNHVLARPPETGRIGRRILGLSLATAALLTAPAVRAQESAFPNRPLRLVVPFAPGGNLDIIGRVVAERLGRDLGQTVVVENRPGANQIIGTQAVAEARPDGYSLGVVSGASVVLNPLLYRKLSYDPVKDLSVLAILLDTPFVAVVNPALPVRSLSELATYSREHAGTINFASAGNGNTTHLAAELFRSASNAEMTHIPFNGSAPALLALSSGDVQVMFDTVSTALPLIHDGRLRALAVTTPERQALLPEVPTVAESGFPGYQATTPVGIAINQQVPGPIQDRLRAALATIQTDRDFRGRMQALGLVPHAPMDAAAIRSRLAEDSARWAAIIRARGIALD